MGARSIIKWFAGTGAVIVSSLLAGYAFVGLQQSSTPAPFSSARDIAVSPGLPLQGVKGHVSDPGQPPAPPLVSRQASSPRVSTTPAATNPTVEGLASIGDFMDYLDGTPTSEIDLDSLVDFINEQPDAFSHLRSAYLKAEDSARKMMLLSVLDNLEHPQKTDLALELAQSHNEENRRKAYEWLSRSGESHTPQVYRVYLDALYREENPSVVADVIANMPVPDRDSDAQSYQSAVTRIQELALHGDENISAQAIAKMSQVAPTPESLGILMTHIEAGSSDLQLAAVQGLRHFDAPGREVMASLNALMQNPSAPQYLRAETVRLIVALENTGRY